LPRISERLACRVKGLTAHFCILLLIHLAQTRRPAAFSRSGCVCGKTSWVVQTQELCERRPVRSAEPGTRLAIAGRGIRGRQPCRLPRWLRSIRRPSCTPPRRIPYSRHCSQSRALQDVMMLPRSSTG